MPQPSVTHLPDTGKHVHAAPAPPDPATGRDQVTTEYLIRIAATR